MRATPTFCAAFREKLFFRFIAERFRSLGVGFAAWSVGWASRHTLDMIEPKRERFDILWRFNNIFKRFKTCSGRRTS